MNHLTIDDYIKGITQGNRSVLARAITLIESEHPREEKLAQELLTSLMPYTGRAHRIGISGVPGVGKSTLIDALGMHLLSLDKKVAVLAIDPSSRITGGSILGDKTRMAHLSRELNAYIRPSPASGTLGGVARKTREAMLLCEAAGFDIVIVETVGVGQSEMIVSDMVDTYLVLMLAGAGDELQGIKRGILEIADILAIQKADGENLIRAQRAQSELSTAMHLLRDANGWQPPVLTCSAIEKKGIDILSEQLEAHRVFQLSSGDFEGKRKLQQIDWMWSMIKDTLVTSFQSHAQVSMLIKKVEQKVASGELPATVAATQLIDIFRVSNPL